MSLDQESKKSTSCGFSGKVEQMQLIDLVQLVCLAQMSQTIQLESGSSNGAIYVLSGKVNHAITGAKSGEGALLDMLQWESGSFELLSYDKAVLPTIAKNWEYLLIEAMRLRSLNAPSSGNSPGGGAPFFFGKISEIPLSDLIQLVCMTRASHTIELLGNEKAGTIFVEAGQVCHAILLPLEGEDAFNELFRWPEGTFDVSPSCATDARSIEKPWEFLLIEAMRLKDEKSAGGSVDGEGEARAQTLYQKVQKMKVAEKIRLAMTGDKETRTLLIRDSNRLVQFAIINNPRISDGEVAMIANSKGVDDEVIRKITENREWMKLYQVRLGLVKNPKTPLPTAIKLISTLTDLDVKLLAKSKAVPMAVATAARRRISDKG